MGQIKSLPLAAVVLGTVLSMWCYSAAAQPVRTAPVRITTAFPSGSGSDVVARTVGKKLQARSPTAALPPTGC